MDGCRLVEPKPSMRHAKFFQSYFCGKRGGPAFVDAVRPDANGNCPQGLSKCSENTPAEHTICRAEKNLCPINSIEFSKKEGLPVKENFKLLVSTTGKGLPIIKTQLAIEPCLKITET
jgi:hypothetical protein